MREQRGVALHRASPGDHPVHAHDVIRRLAAWAAIPKINQPGAISWLLGRQPLVFAIIPLDEVEVDDGLIAKPASSQVSRARCIGLQRTSANVSARVPAASASPSRRPLSVNGMSVVPVCWPLRLQAVSPCLIANTFTFSSPSRSDVVGRCRTNRRGSRLLPPPPAGDLGHIVPVPVMNSLWSMSLSRIACLA